MPSKVTYFFHDNLGGFSESWIDPTQLPPTYPAGAIAAYLIARMNVSGLQTVWDYVRITDTNPANARRVRVVFAGDPNMTNLNVPPAGIYATGRGAPLQASDFAGTRFLVRKQSVDLYQARMFFGGFPDNQCDNGGQYTPNGQFPNQFFAFQNQVVALQYGWLSYTVPLVGYKAALLSAVTGGDGTCTFTAVPIGVNPPIFIGPYAPGQHVVVRIANQNQPKNVNGTFTVIVTGPNTARTVKPLSVTNFIVGNGTIAIKQTVQTKTVNELKIERIVKRGPGRPFGLYRGRALSRPRG